LFDKVTLGTFRLLMLSSASRKPGMNSFSLFVSADESNKGLWLQQWLMNAPAPQQVCYHLLASGFGKFLYLFGAYVVDLTYQQQQQQQRNTQQEHQHKSSLHLLENINALQVKTVIAMLSTLMGDPHARKLVLGNTTLIEPDISFEFSHQGLCFLRKGAPDLGLDTLKDLEHVADCNKLWRYANVFEGASIRRDFDNAHWYDGSLTKLMIDICMQRSEIPSAIRSDDSLVQRCAEALVSLAAAGCHGRSDSAFQAWHPGACLSFLSPSHSDAEGKELSIAARIFSELVASSPSNLASAVVLSDQFARLLRLSLTASVAQPCNLDAFHVSLRLVAPPLRHPLFSQVVVNSLVQMSRKAFKDDQEQAGLSSLIAKLAPLLASTACGCLASWNLLTLCCAQPSSRLWLLPASLSAVDTHRALITFRQITLLPGSWAFLEEAKVQSYLWDSMEGLKSTDLGRGLSTAGGTGSIGGLMVNLPWQFPFLMTLAVLFPSEFSSFYKAELTKCLCDQTTCAMMSEVLLFTLLRSAFILPESALDLARVVVERMDKNHMRERLNQAFNQATQRVHTAKIDCGGKTMSAISKELQSPSRDDLIESGGEGENLIVWNPPVAYKHVLQSGSTPNSNAERNDWLRQGIEALFGYDPETVSVVDLKVRLGLSRGGGQGPGTPLEVVCRAEQIVARSNECQRLVGVLVQASVPIGCLILPMLRSCFLNVLERSDVIFQLSLYAFHPSANHASFAVALLNCVLLPRLVRTLALVNSAGGNSADRATAAFVATLQQSTPLVLDRVQRQAVLTFIEAHPR
jgi:hypothetical protein